MTTTKTKPKPPSQRKPAPPPSSAKTSYLLAYNALSAALWAGVLYRVVTIGAQQVLDARRQEAALTGGKPSGLEGVGGFVASGSFANLGGGNFGGLGGSILGGLGSGEVYEQLEVYTRWVQSLAGLEVVHSLLGIVRAPLLTTLMQVSSRFLLVWAIAYPFPTTTAPNPAYATMLLAWSVTEVIRYSYFVFNLSSMGVPRIWTWLRYNTFLVLYPLGVASECWCIYTALPAAAMLRPELQWGAWAVLATYVPGFYVLFTHMLRQRGKVMRASGKRV